MSARRRHDDRGAVLVEFALVASLVLTIMFGLVEFGFAWETRLTTQQSARAGARVGSSWGDERMADYNLLISVRSALEAAGLDNVEYVIVYDSATADGEPHPSCLGATPTSQWGRCNVYTGAELQALAAGQFSGTTSCGGSALDRFWCPVDRETTQAAGTDYIGIYIRMKHNFITGVFGDEMTITDNAVMRLEPSEG